MQKVKAGVRGKPDHSLESGEGLTQARDSVVSPLSFWAHFPSSSKGQADMENRLERP